MEHELLSRPAHSKATHGDRSPSFAFYFMQSSIPNGVKCAPSLSSFKSRLKTCFVQLTKSELFILIIEHMCMAWTCY